MASQNRSSGLHAKSPCTMCMSSGSNQRKSTTKKEGRRESEHINQGRKRREEEKRRRNRGEKERSARMMKGRSRGIKIGE